MMRMAGKSTTDEDMDLALAAELQAVLLPTEIPEAGPHHSFSARNRMCHSVGGDFYDFIVLNDQQVAVTIGDVVGHGVRASLVMAQIMGFLRSRPADLSRPVRLVESLNEMLIALGDKLGALMPCSLFYMVLDLPSGVCFYVNAGHPKPILFNQESRQSRLVPGNTVLLGVEPFRPDEMCHTFVSGERLVMYTDGIVDCHDRDGVLFGHERLRDIVVETCHLEPSDLADHVFATVEQHRNSRCRCDDETIVVVDRL